MKKEIGGHLGRARYRLLGRSARRYKGEKVRREVNKHTSGRVVLTQKKSGHK